MSALARVAASFAAAAMVVACGSSTPPSPKVDPNAPVVQTQLPSADGDLVSVPLPGKRSTVLDFWSPTCEPCKKSVPALVARRADIEAKGGALVLVGVLADGESTDDGRRALESWGVKSSFLVDRGGVAQREAGVRDLPATIVLDEGGRVVWVAPLGATEDDVVAAVP